MYTLSTLLLAALAALATGLGIGALLTRQLSTDGKKQRELERRLEELLKQQKDYQHEVVEHFTDTAQLLGKLAESYRDVHNHLANGASNLCEDDSGDILQRIPDNSLTQFSDRPDLDTAQPPLDYAPKVSPHATGVLNEEFGLDKDKKMAGPELVIDGPLPKQA